MGKREGYIEKIIKKVNDYQYVSFDLFDTLIKRNVQKPDDVFQLIENRGIKKYGYVLKGFYKKRIEAEKIERLKNKKEEITLHDIYLRLSNAYSNEVVQWAEREEIDLEIRLCTINCAMADIYAFCVERKKKIQITTDIYLSYETILFILERVGISDWDNVWVSSKTRYTKMTGKLFEYELNKLGISAKELIHIGDNEKSDYVIPKKMGIYAIKIKNSMNHMHYPGRTCYSTEDNYAVRFINNNILGVSSEQRLGFECMGPLLYGFSVWLIKSLKMRGIKKVYFFSRDGWILKKSFDLLNDSKVKSNYFYVSRRALLIPLLSFSPSYSEYIGKIYWPSKISIVYFLYTLGIEDEKELSEICNRYGISRTYTVIRDEVVNCNIFQKIFNEKLVDISNYAKKELDNLHQYILQENMSGKFAVVDIGWRGNMQKNLLEILNRLDIASEVYGYYIGIDRIHNHSGSIRMCGFAFDQIREKNIFNIEKDVNSLFEEIFMAPHGSVKTYKYTGSKVVPILYKNEQNDAGSIDLLRHYQKGALLFVEKITEYKDLIHISNRFSIMGVLTQFTKPCLEDAVSWGKIIFKDTSEESMIVGGDILGYLKNPLQFLRDYKSSKWKIGFLKKTFHVKLDYYLIFKIITQIRFWISCRLHGLEKKGRNG